MVVTSSICCQNLLYVVGFSWSRLITLSPSSLISMLVTAIDDDVDDDNGEGLLMLTRADFSEASAINALICSFFLFSPSYTTLEIKVAFKASESVGKSFKEKTPESFKVKFFCFVDGYRLNLWGSAIMESSVGLNAMDDYTLITLLPVRIIAHKNQSSKSSEGARKATEKLLPASCAQWREKLSIRRSSRRWMSSILLRFRIAQLLGTMHGLAMRLGREWE